MSSNTNNPSVDEALDAVIKISIYNAKLYEETGYKEFASAWLSFPATQEEVQAALKEIGVDGKNYSRYLIDDRSSAVDGLADCLPKKANIDELNYLAVKLQDIDELKLEILCAVIDKNSRDLSIKELINTVDNLDCYALYPARNAKDYGEFLSQIIFEDISAVAAGIYGSSEAEAYGKLMSQIDELEKYVDTEKYGRETAKLERGSFTDFGYLTQHGELTENYTGISDIPAEYRIFAYPDEVNPAGLYKIENTDLSDFIYKLHVLAGDYTGDVHWNMNMFPENFGEDYIILMNSSIIKIIGIGTAYDYQASINSFIRKSPHDMQTFMFHIDNRENGRAFGSIIMTDCILLADTINQNSDSYFSAVSDMANIKEFFNQSLQEAEAIALETLLDYLNAEYMALAKYSQPGMLRVPQETAKTMLLNEDAPVFRLMPRAPEQLSIIAAATGLNFKNFCEFAVRKDSKSSIDKACRRETDKLIDNPLELDGAKKRNKSEPEV